MSVEMLQSILPPSSASEHLPGRMIIVSHYLPIKCTLKSSAGTKQFYDAVVNRLGRNGSGLNGNAEISNHSDFNLPASNDVPLTSPECEPPFSPTSSSTFSSKENGSIWRFSKRNDHSALYSGVLSLREKNHCVFVGVVDKFYGSDGQALPISNLNDEYKQALVDKLWEEHNAVPVFLDSNLSFGHYEGFCKQVLWPILHYILWNPTNGKKEKIYWDAFNQVNQTYADTIEKIWHEKDFIWINDYHLMLLPALLRRSLPSAIIGFFLHTPFPSSEIFRCIPQREELLLGLLGSSILGFQTYAYARHFISACTRVLGVETTPKGIEYKGGHVAIGIFPIGIDVKQIEEYRQAPGVLEKVKAIRELYAGKKIIIGRDKLDHIKGVLHKLNAFEKFLEKNPEWQNKVVLIQVTSPTEASTKLETKVSEMVARINGTFGSLDFAPVHHYHHHIDRAEYYALLSVADVALITSVRDGMNTTSHEYVVCQKNTYGPLILSEFTGTAGCLSSAILVNPWDYSGVANAIKDALTMTKEEKMIKHTHLYEYVMMNSARYWAEKFLAEMIHHSNNMEETNPTPVLDKDLLCQQFKMAKKRVLFLDYDGTLTPIRKTPNAAVPPSAVLKSLEILCNDPNSHVYIISGRDQSALDGWLGHIDNLGMSAEHGSFMKYPNSNEWINLSKEMDMGWKNDVLPIFEYYTERTPGSFIEQKKSSLTWHYRLADPSYGSWQAKECHNHLENAILSKKPVEILLGKKNIEVRPQQINKGEIVKKLLSYHSADVDFIFCAGDDKTDEDMFRALKSINLLENTSFTCTIGSATKKTMASWHVPKTEDLIVVLSKLANTLKC